MEEKVNTLQRTLTDYINSDSAWKVENQDALDNMRNLTNGWKMFISFITSLGAIGGAFWTLHKLFKL